MDSSSIATRLKAIIQYLGLTDSQFADQCDISRATLSLLLSGKNKKISDVLLSQIHSAFPNVSIIWLLFEEGNIFINPATYKFTQPEINFDADENQDLLSNTQEVDENGNLKGLNYIEDSIKNTVIKAFDSFLEDKGFKIEKNSGTPNKRKVRQITVYYDDSTFETFSPIN